MIPAPWANGPIHIGHKPDHASYPAWGGMEGIAMWAKLGVKAADIDVQCDAEGIVWCIHWGRPLQHGFADPTGTLRRFAHIGTMTTAQVEGLVGDWPDCKGVRPWRMSEVQAFARDCGVVPFYELKDSPGFLRAETYQQFVDAAEATGWPLAVMTMPNLGGTGKGYDRLKLAKAAGIPTVLLQRGLTPRRYAAVADAVKGPKRWAVLLPTSVVRLGHATFIPGNGARVGAPIPRTSSGLPPVRPPKPIPPKAVPVKISAPAPDYIAARRTSDGDNKPIRRIVIHSTVSSSAAGTARKIARYFASTKAKGSAHYVVDAGEELQCVYDGVIAWHAPPNAHSLGVELCDNPSQDVKRWDDDDHKAVLARAAKLVAQLCLAYDVPIRKLGKADLLAGKRGICGHVDVSRAFRQSTHWDPGAFPWDVFLAQVRAEAAAITKAAQVAAARKGK